MAVIPKPAFPNVPQLPGVPQLPRSPLFPPGPAPALNAVIALGRLALALTSKPLWGIYKVPAPTVVPATTGGSGLDTVVVTPAQPPVIVPDSFSKFSYKQEWQVATAPVQEGGFASYNKVSTPFEITFRMVKGGSLESRKQFLDSLESVSGSLDLYKVATPERTYLNCNITGYRVVRDGAQGAYFLTEVEVSFIEIRVAVAQYTSTAANTQNATNPAAKPVTNQGTLNSIPAASRVATAVNSVLTPLRRLAAIVGAI
jgi:hypothetical protein